MTIITEAQAIAAARAYAASKECPAWREGSLLTERFVIEGIDCWRVSADDAPQPGDTWLDEEIDGGQSYLVDANTGECIGTYGLHYHLFRPRPGQRKKRPSRRSRKPGWRGLLNLLRLGSDDHH